MQLLKWQSIRIQQIIQVLTGIPNLGFLVRANRLKCEKSKTRHDTIVVTFLHRCHLRVLMA